MSIYSIQCDGNLSWKSLNSYCTHAKKGFDAVKYDRSRQVRGKKSMRTEQKQEEDNKKLNQSVKKIVTLKMFFPSFVEVLSPNRCHRSIARGCMIFCANH